MKRKRQATIHQATKLFPVITLHNVSNSVRKQAFQLKVMNMIQQAMVRLG
jgi:hypothetical protein